MAKQNVPFFARFLETQTPKVKTGVKAGAETGATADRRRERTQKAPSDFDEMVTMKYPSDDDEYYAEW